MSRQTGGHTCASPDALAVREDPSSPAVRPGPIHRMGRAARCRAHALTGSASARRNIEDESHPNFARTLFPRPVQADEAEPARDSAHDTMRLSRWHGRVDERAHLPDCWRCSNVLYLHLGSWLARLGRQRRRGLRRSCDLLDQLIGLPHGARSPFVSITLHVGLGF